MSVRRRARPALLLPALLAPSLCLGENWPSDDAIHLDVSLDFNRYETTLESEGEQFDTRFTKLGMSLVETGYGRFRPGLLLGWLELKQSDNPGTEGLIPSGGYLGLSLDYTLLDRPHLGLGLTGTYLYHWVEDVQRDPDTDEVTAETQMQWSESTLGAWAELRFGRVDLIGSGTYYYIDGDEVVREPDSLRGTYRFENADDLTAAVGARFWTDNTGRFELLGNLGAREGITIRFVRSY